MNASMAFNVEELFIKNDDFDSERREIEFFRFPLVPGADIIHYYITDDDGTIIDGIKWVNFDPNGTHDNIFGFEFESQQKFTEFARHVSKYVQLFDEECQYPALRRKRLKSAAEKLKVSIDFKLSYLYQQQLMPKLDTTEECKLKYDLEFKKAVILSLGHLYKADSILFMSPADLYMLVPGLTAPVLADPGVVFLIIRHKKFRVSLDIVRDSQIVMRILIDNHFICSPYNATRKVTWVEPLNEGESRTWRADLVEPVDSLETIINIAKFECEKKMLDSGLSEDDQNYIIGGYNESSGETSERQGPMEIYLDKPLAQVIDEDVNEINDTAVGIILLISELFY